MELPDRTEKETSITEENIQKFINSFYTKVRKDESLGPFFTKVIGKEDEKWYPHLRTMYDFWSSLMLASNRYHGNPFQKHLDLPPFEPSLFDRWLSLFEETAYQVYIEDVANQYIEKSRRIAGNFKRGLYSMKRKDF